MTGLAEMGAAFLAAHNAARGPVPLWVRVAKLGEEAGEAVGAYLRSEGHSRRIGPRSDFYDELADVVLGAYIIAAQDGGDLDAAVQAKFQAIMSRGFGGITRSATSVILECARCGYEEPHAPGSSMLQPCPMCAPATAGSDVA